MSDMDEDDISNLGLDELIKNIFDLLDAGCGKTTGKQTMKRNPKRFCLHCSWTQTGTRHNCIQHILGTFTTRPNSTEVQDKNRRMFELACAGAGKLGKGCSSFYRSVFDCT